MANAKHVEILRRGTASWNAWRRQNPGVAPDLRNLNFANPYHDEGHHPVFNQQGEYFDLRNSDFRGADLTGADLSFLDLSNANLSHAKLIRCLTAVTHFDDADLRHADFTEARLNAQFCGAQLQHTKFIKSDFMAPHAFGDSHMGATILAGIDLSEVVDLEEVVHDGPSFVTIDTIIQSRGRIPVSFLRGLGFSESEIMWVGSFPHSRPAFRSCFISYSHQDAIFATRLHDYLQSRGIRCWRDEKQLEPGQDLYQFVERGIAETEAALLCCSRHSLTSWWVDNEIGAIFEKEQRLTRQRNAIARVLIPLDLDGYLFDPGWASGYGPMLRRRSVLDFTQWEQEPQTQYDRLEKLIQGLAVSPSP